MNYLIRVKLKETIKLQDIIKKDNLTYKSKREKLKILANIHYLMYLRDAHEGYLSLENADHKQSNFAIELKNFEKDTKTLAKKYLLNNLRSLFCAREKVLNSF